MLWWIDKNDLIWHTSRSCESIKVIVTKEKILSQICQRFGTSISTVKGIIKQFGPNVKREEIYSRIRCNKKIQSLQIKELISKYVKSTSWNFTSSNIKEYILKEWLILIPNHQIRMHLKTHEHLS